jgi:hypothetical protein
MRHESKLGGGEIFQHAAALGYSHAKADTWCFSYDNREPNGQMHLAMVIVLPFSKKLFFQICASSRATLSHTLLWASLMKISGNNFNQRLFHQLWMLLDSGCFLIKPYEAF